MKNVEDMPIEHWMSVETFDQIEQVLSYNENDVEATFEFFLYTIGMCEHPVYKGKNKIEMRKKLNKTFGINCLNFNDVKIGERLLLKLYCQETNQNIYEIKSKIDYNVDIDLNKCILPHIKFESDCFNELIKWFRQQRIKSTKSVFSNLPLTDLGNLAKYIHPDSIKSSNKKVPVKHVENINIDFNGTRIDYGVGGLHTSRQGIVKSDDEWMIFDLDVGLKVAQLKPC